MSHSRKEWDRLRAAWASEMTNAAKASAPRLKKCFGSIAWGRFDGESAASGDTKDNVAFGVGFLQGARYALMMVAVEFGLEGESELRRIHEAVRRRMAVKP